MIISKYWYWFHTCNLKCWLTFMIFWYYHDLSKYQAPPHLVTSLPKYDVMISVSIFWYYHDILILSWYMYIKISNPSTRHVTANISYDDISIDILILSWCSDIIIIYQTILILFWYQHDISCHLAVGISKYPNPLSKMIHHDIITKNC